jgi:WD40 repeat protein
LAGDYFNALMAPLGPADNRAWDAAEPYLFRHVADHAADADRTAEIEDDPGLLLHPHFLDLTSTAGDSQAVSSLTARTRLFEGLTSPAELALAAARAGWPDLARRAANVSGHPPLLWQPRWTLGTPGPQLTARRAPALEPEAAPVENGPPVRAVAIARGGPRFIAVGPRDTRSWSGPQITEEQVQGLAASAVALSFNGTNVLRGDSQGRVWLDNQSGEHQMLPQRHKGEVKAVAFAERRCVSVDTEGTIFVWTPSQEIVESHDTGRHSNHWAIAADSSHVVACSAGFGGQVRIFRPGETEKVWDPGLAQITAIAISQDFRHVIVADQLGAVMVHDRATGASWSAGSDLTSPVVALATSTDGAYVISGEQNGTVHVWRMASGDLVRSMTLSEVPIYAVAVGDGGHRVVAADTRGNVYFGQTETNKVESWRPPKQFPPLRHLGTPPVVDVRPVAVETDQPMVTAFRWIGSVLVGWSDGTTQHVHGTSGDPYTDFGAIRIADAPILSISGLVEVAGDYGLLISCQDRSNWLWFPDSMPDKFINVSGWQGVAELQAPPSAAGHIVVNGRLVAVSADPSGKIWLSQANGDASPLVFGEHPLCTVVVCAHINDRPTAFTAGDDGVVRVWDLIDHRLIDTITIGHGVWKISADPNGTLFVGAGGELLAYRHISAVMKEQE